jgi:hypothetical protein
MIQDSEIRVQDLCSRIFGMRIVVLVVILLEAYGEIGIHFTFEVEGEFFQL